MLTTSRFARHRQATPHADRRLAKHSFGWEAGLVEVLCAQAGRFSLRPGHHEVRTEWAVSNRIADVAMSTFISQPRLDSRLKSLSRLTMVELAVLAGLVDGACNVNQLATGLYLRPAIVDRALERLKQLGLIELMVNSTWGTFRAADWKDALPTSLHLIEAKLDDWEQAIGQASNYRRFADGASVALPLSFVGRADVYAACEAKGVGLILLQADGDGFQAVAPAAPEPRWQRIRCQSYVEILRDFVLKNAYATSLHSCTEH